MTDIKSCPACGSDVLEIFHKLESGPYVRCLACGYFNLVDAWQTGANGVGTLASRFITRVRFLEMERERLTMVIAAALTRSRKGEWGPVIDVLGEALIYPRKFEDSPEGGEL